MVKDPIRSHEQSIGEESVRERTGRSRQEWFALLDAEGAAAWTHRQIANHLADGHGVDPWWSQSITVGYEQARGIRAPGQRPDGTWEASASVTVPGDLDEVFAWVSDPDRRGRWLDTAPAEVRGQTPGKSIRWTWDDGARLEVRFTALKSAAAGPRTRVTVAHRGLPDAAAVRMRKVWWRERLDKLKELAAHPG